MDAIRAIVVTSISGPNRILRALANECQRRNHRFYVIGDAATPNGFRMEGCDYYDLELQRATGFAFAVKCGERNYARKNIGYLLAKRHGAEIIVETDDDNLPNERFWVPRRRKRMVRLVKQLGWANAYSFFTDMKIWPRGFPLECVQQASPAYASLPTVEVDAPIQQGLANENPDVDAIYRLTGTLPITFFANRSVGFEYGVWTPFNSQNTMWWSEAFPLMYLPVNCSIRMTDIWRGFVAQRIAWENEWRLLFDSPTVSQDRNHHDLLRDFELEIPGYIRNGAIGERLASLKLRRGSEFLSENMYLCYEELIRNGWINKTELELLGTWFADLSMA